MNISIRKRRINVRVVLLSILILTAIIITCFFIKPSKNVDAITLQRSPIDVVLVIDDSGSMADSSKMVSAKSAAIDFIMGNTTKGITGLQVGDRVAAITLNRGSIINLTSDFNAAKMSINGINASGGTSYTPALQTAKSILDGKNSSSTPVIIFLSDGEPGDGNAAVNYCNNTLKPAGVQIYTIGLGVAANSNAEVLLKAMASSTTNTNDHYSSGSAADLANIYNNISASLIKLLSLASEAKGYSTLSDYPIYKLGGIILDQSIVIKSAATVYINSNITNPNYKNGQTYKNASDLNQMVIIAKNIKISPEVTNVDAWLIASDSIYTCYSNDNDKMNLYLGKGGDGNDGLTIDFCNKQLIINGPVMADHLYMLRTYGAGVGNTGDISSNTPAEIFNLRADAYLWAAARSLVNGRVQTTYTTELPPRF
jgi:Mg-chelatase subunit ChlD